MKIIDNLNDFIEQVDNAKKINPLDLSKDQDLTIAIMNLVSIEEHLVFSGAKTKDTSFYDMVETIREYRKESMQKIIKTYRGEVWCISKHLLAASMRLMEVGTKLLHQDNRQEAYEFFEKAYNLYCIFWGLNLDSISNKDALRVLKEMTKNAPAEPPICHAADEEEGGAENTKAKEKDGDEEKDKDKRSILSKLKKFIGKSIDCCRE